MSIKLVVFDLGMTLWNYANASDLKLPFSIVGPNSLRDAKGSVVSLFNGVRELLENLQDRRKVMSIASWNDPPPVIEVLKQLNLDSSFIHPQIEWNRPKIEMIQTIVKHLVRDGMSIDSSEILFVDDNDKHLESVKRVDSRVKLAKAWTNPSCPAALLKPCWMTNRTLSRGQ